MRGFISTLWKILPDRLSSFSYKGSEKTLKKDSKAKSYLKFKRLNNKKGQIFVNCPLHMNLIFSVNQFKREVFVPLSGSVFHTRFFSCCFMLYLLMKTFFYSHSSLLRYLFLRSFLCFWYPLLASRCLSAKTADLLILKEYSCTKLRLFNLFIVCLL